MKELTLLNQKCLGNMPMLLDAIAVTLNSLNETLSSVYDEMEQFLKQKCSYIRYEVSEDTYTKGAVYVMGGEEDYKNQYLDDLKPVAIIDYQLFVSQCRKRNPIQFNIQFGLLCEEEQYVLYFQLKNQSMKENILESISVEKVKQAVSALWDVGTIEDSLYIEFAIDETLSVDKIKKCAEDFKQHILIPVFSLLESKFEINAR